MTDQRKMYTKTCAICGSTFKTAGKSAKYCPRCKHNKAKMRAAEKRAYNSIREWTYTCPICGEVFMTKKWRIYCSDECARKAKIQKQQKEFVFYKQTISDIHQWFDEGDSEEVLAKVFQIPRDSIDKCLSLHWDDIPEEGLTMSQLMAL